MRRFALSATLAAIAACSGGKETAQAERATEAATPCGTAQPGHLSAVGAWVREQADQSAMSAGYFVICNRTAAPVVLTGVTTAAAGMSELHETTRGENGIVSMAPIGEATIQPGKSISFEPGGKHVMLMRLTQPIESDSRVLLTLHFADGMTLDVEAETKSNAESAGHATH